MAGVYIYSDKPEAAAEFAAFAKSVGKFAAVLITRGDNVQAFSKVGADRIYVLNGESSRPENYAKSIAAFLQESDAELFMVSSTYRGRELAAGVAGYLDCTMASDITDIRVEAGCFLVKKMAYGGSVAMEERFTGLAVVTAPSGMFEPAYTHTGPEVTEISAQSDIRAVIISTEPLGSQSVDLSKAEKIVSVGMGFDKQEDLQLAQELAKVLGAEMGCSRAVAEERHWMPEANYVGITGTKVKPRLYMAVGISGQIQHVYGIRDAKVIVAINKDEKAPIFRAADYGIVGDLYEYLPLLTQALKEIDG